MTLGEMVAAVREELLEPSEGFWKDDEIKRWINRAAKDLARAANIEVGPDTLPVVAGQESYPLPDDFSSMRRIEAYSLDGDLVAKLMPIQIDHRTAGKGTPRYYYVWKGLLHLDPIPDSDLNLVLWYHRAQPDLVDDSDTPIIPEEFHELCVLFAVSQAKRKAGDPAYETYAIDYSNGRLDMIQKLKDMGQKERQWVPVDDWEGW